MVVPQHNCRGLIGRKLAQGAKQVAALRELGGVLAWRRAAEPSHQLTDLPHASLSKVVVGDIDCNSVQPRFRRGIRFPRLPGFERPDEGVMRAVLGCGPITEDPVDRVEDPIEARLIQAIEVFDGSRFVLQLEHGQQPYDGGAADILLAS